VFRNNIRSPLKKELMIVALKAIVLVKDIPNTLNRYILIAAIRTIRHYRRFKND